MKKNVTSLSVMISVVLLAFMTCKLVEDSGESSQGVNALRLSTSDVSPWVEDAGGFIDFTASNMQNLVNGGAPQYVEKGLVAGFQQEMSNSTKKNRLLMLDFGTDANATAMYNKKGTEIGNKASSDKYDQTVAMLDNGVSGGALVIAHFGKYYMELSFTEYSDKSEARTDAVSFVEVFQVKISELK